MTESDYAARESADADQLRAAIASGDADAVTRARRLLFAAARGYGTAAAIWLAARQWHALTTTGDDAPDP